MDPERSFSLCCCLSPCPSLGPSLYLGCDARCRVGVSAVCSSEPLMPSAYEHVYGLYNEPQPDSRETQIERLSERNAKPLRSTFTDIHTTNEIH